ncbi:hypothetical protein BWK59_09575 [Flavobacterium davisii]|uniref:C-type lysozyme inhibitor domain-containing protein n=1 Tax=Flavobacterium davisii TaxID=2906077 RepID=A0A246GJ38_9FLAO|nr:hypothetical protein [Flavobacterium davisii]OWP83625.1 hypothetical protein BWK59_09575 [Flavobacterium davisii]
MKKVIIGVLLMSAFISCKKESESNTKENEVTQEKVDQYNKDEVEMIENSDTTSYKSIDGKRSLKIIYTPEFEKEKRSLEIQLKEGEQFKRLEKKGEDSGNPVYSDGKISWMTKETGGKGTLTEDNKKIEFVMQ